jgi:ribosome-binding protein aMBF1 (putative translation factor)
LIEQGIAGRNLSKTPRFTLAIGKSAMIKTRKKRTITNALEIIDRMIGDDPQLREMIEQESFNSQVAQLIYDARTKAGLTQAQLAKLIGTKQPVIARLEDADYEGHSLTMLQKIAAALHQRLEIRFAAN